MSNRIFVCRKSQDADLERKHGETEAKSLLFRLE